MHPIQVGRKSWLRVVTFSYSWPLAKINSTVEDFHGTNMAVANVQNPYTGERSVLSEIFTISPNCATCVVADTPLREEFNGVL